ncbi:MAG: hypothetical protein LC799_17110, partial [Actinobacteria bacterium]|nr:hypothetical protein [Actinomycetota bacterium]
MPATPALVSAPACALPLLDDLLLVLAKLRGRGVGVGGGGLLVGQCLLELGLVGLRQLRLGDLRVGHLLVGLMRTGREVDLLGWRRLGHRTRGRERHRLVRLLLGHRRDRLRDRRGLIRWGLGGGLDVLGLALLALRDQALDLALDLAYLAGLFVVVGLL